MQCKMYEVADTVAVTDAVSLANVVAVADAISNTVADAYADAVDVLDAVAEVELEIELKTK